MRLKYESYQVKQENWDQIRGNMAQKLSLISIPKTRKKVAMAFYQGRQGRLSFSCKYIDGEEEAYTIQSYRTLRLWTTELVGMSRESENYKIDNV